MKECLFTHLAAMNKNKIQQEIERRNTLFAGKTPAEQRVLIAQDVIALLEVGRLKASNEYLDHPVRNYYMAGLQAQTVLLESPKSCACCAKGAIFVSYILFKNDLKCGKDFEDVFDGVKRNRPALDIFPADMLEDLENCYEGFDGQKRWIDKYPDRMTRLIALMENIIANNGEFIPHV